ncbi:MAG TPA: right-handed parallel beta-helix repeat-containing protein, partial [Candidatus Hydrogenedentes bacterium]|nr:right-handed parallel beta-helix repeat-containing protein [Candidatus Hydrogenedentota bacterium]
YYISEAIVFGPEDSGSETAPVTYAAYPDERPIVHGGRAVTDWRKDGSFWVADIPAVKDGSWEFSALWVNGERCQPARTPNATNPAGDEPTDADYFYAAGPVMEKDPASGKEDRSATRFYYREGDLDAWGSLKDATFVVFHSWATALLRPKDIDVNERIISFTGPTRWGFCRWRSDQRYFVEHLFEGLDQPGEWFLNREEGRLYYIPRPGEDMETAEAIAPVAKQLVVLEGKPAEGQFVSHLTFRGLHMLYTEYSVKPEGHSDGQAASSVPAAFQGTGARHCNVEYCTIGHVGTYGVWFRTGCQDNRLFHCELVDLGAGGVRIGESGDPPSENEAALRNVIDNNFIHDAGRIFRSAVGVWIGRSSYNTISHNEICDIRYSGLSIGWSWGYAPSSANHNIIEFNHVHHVGHGQLSDMGVIYTLGVSPGTVIRNNVFHDSMSNPRVSGGWGVYTDEGSSDILVENNIVYNTLTGTFHQHYGRENVLRNNVFAYSHSRGQLIRSREEDHVSFIFERNIVLFNNGQLLGSTWKNGNWKLDHNCYWDTSGYELDFAGRTLEQWQAEGHDVHSIVADPLFVDAQNADFRLKPDSPAFDLGFVPIDTSEVGLYGEPEWVARPKQIEREPFSPPAPPEPTTINDGFEDTAVGHTPSGAQANEEGAGTIRVTDETAATGTRCLKFMDAPGLERAYNPHLVYNPHLRRGTAVASCALRLEPGAILYHEWRDSSSPYRVGPSIWFDAEGNLSSRGNVLMKVPHSTWFTLQIACGLGRQADGTYDLTVTVGDDEQQCFEALSCGSPAFNRLEWFGFVANAQAAVISYLDDVALTTQ